MTNQADIAADGPRGKSTLVVFSHVAIFGILLVVLKRIDRYFLRATYNVVR